MAKVTWRQAGKDDPIFDGRVVISSHNKQPPKDKSPEELYPDLQKLPFDPAVEFLKKLKQD